MPFAPGTPKPPGSGRHKGTSKSETVREICARLKCDPFEGMAKLAMDPKSKRELRGRMYAELAQYLAPKLKAIEHSGPGGGPIDVRTSGAEELARRVDALAERLTKKSDEIPG